MELIVGLRGRWQRWNERTWPASMAIASMTVGAGILILAQLAARPVAPDEAARAICDDAVHRALTADTLLEFERARFVVEGMGCSRSRRIRDMYPAARATRGE